MTGNKKLWGLFGGATLLAWCVVGTMAIGKPAEATKSAREGTPEGYARSLSNAFRDAAQKVLPSVVAIRNTVTSAVPEQPSSDRQFGPPEKGPFGDMFGGQIWRFFREIPSMPRMPEVSNGSGVIIDSDGIILTNSHVVAGGGKVMVRLHDGREFEATDVKTDPRTDLAVVWLKGASDLPAADIGDSDAVDIGDWVLALGQPFGLQDTVTAGIISAKDRGIGIANREDFLQTDAAINPGNSGGPLVDLAGKVIGINTAITSRSGGYQGVGFAIPVNLAMWVGKQLIHDGVVHRAYLGVAIQTVTPELARQFGVEAKDGAVVTDVFPDTPGSEAGLEPGDVIVAFARKDVSSARDLQAAVEESKIGSSQSVAIVRNGKRMTLDVTVRQQPENYGMGPKFGHSATPQGQSALSGLGIEVEPLTDELARQLDMTGVEGVVITAVKPGSPAELAGLTPSLVITQINRTTVKNAEDCREALKKRSSKDGVLLLVRSPEGSRFIVIHP